MLQIWAMILNQGGERITEIYLPRDAKNHERSLAQRHQADLPARHGR